MSSPAGLSLHPLRATWAVSTAETLVPVLVKLRPEAAPGTLPLDLVVAIAAGSGLAAERGLELALQAIRPIIDGARPEDRVGVLLFGERARVVLATEAVGDGTMARRLLSLEQVEALGERVDLEAGMKAVADQIRPLRTLGRAARVVVIVGDPMARDAVGEREARLLADAGVGLSVVGVGHGWSAPLATRIADAGRGELWHAPRPIDLPAVLREEVTFGRALAHGEALLHLKLAAGVRLRRVLRVFPGLAHWLPSQPSDREALVKLGDVPGDRPVYALIELVVPAQGAGTTRLAQIEAHWRHSGHTGRVGRGTPADVVVAFGERAASQHAEAAYYVDRVQTYTLVERALEARREDGAERVATLLRNAKRIADESHTRIGEALGSALAVLESTGLLPDAQATPLLIEARQPE